MTLSGRRKLFLTASIVIFILVWVTALHLSGQEQSPVILDEVCTGNVSVIADENGKYRNYAELGNSSDTDQDLSGWYLSDNRKKPKKQKLEGVVVPAHGTALVWLGSSAEQEEPDGITFDLSPNGGTLILTDGSGRIRSSVRIPYLKFNTSYSLIDGNWKVSTCTPGQENGTAQVLPRITLSEPVLSRESGFYDEPFDLTMAADFGQEVWYTTDGSEPAPGAGTSKRYTGAIRVEDISSSPNQYSSIDTITIPNNYTPEEPVDKAVVIRAIAATSEGTEESRIVTATYFVGYQNRTEYQNVPVISLVSDPVNLFDYYKGIYTVGVKREEYNRLGGFENMDPEEAPAHFTIDPEGNVILPEEETPDTEGTVYWRYEYTNSQNGGRQSERAVTVNVFDAGHKLRLTQDAGIRIAGESSRAALQKSMNMFARRAYDPETGGTFSDPFSEGDEISKIRLRTSDDTGFSLDALLMTLAEDRICAVQKAIPAAVFLDGEYWGLYYLREQYTKDYFQNHYGTNPDNLWVMKNYEAAIGDPECVHNYDIMVQQMTLADMSDPVQYGAVVYNVNLDSLIDWYCLNIYADNEDLTATHNLERWKTAVPEDSEYGDARWNFALYDMDQCCALDGNSSNPAVNTIEVYKNLDEKLYLPGYLSANEAFRKQYCLTMMDVANTTYSYERVHKKLEEWKAAYGAQVVKTIGRFVTEDGEEELFEDNCLAVDSFFRDRRSYMEEYLREDQGLSGDIVKVHIQSGEGEGAIRINSSQLQENETADGWTGEYFSDFPVTVTAEPEEGFIFRKWVIESADGSIREVSSAQTTVDLADGDVALTACFDSE